MKKFTFRVDFPLAGCFRFSAPLAVLFFLYLGFVANGADGYREKPLPQLSFLTEEWEPYQYTEDGTLKGLTIDLLHAILEEAGSEQTLSDVEVLPWARGYSRVKTQPNTVLFSMTRTPEREKMFKWVGPILKNDTYFIGRKDKNIRIAKSADLHRYNFGVIIDDASEMFAKRHGIPEDRITKNSRAELNMKMLKAGRIDFVITGWTAFQAEARKAGASPSDYDRVFLADSSDVYFAFSSATSDWIVARFESAFNSVMVSGKFNHLVRAKELNSDNNQF